MLFWLGQLRSLRYFIKRNLPLTLTKCDIYADCGVRLFVGKQYYRLDMARLLQMDVR